MIIISMGGFFMNISVSNELMYLKNQLRKKGYNVLDSNDKEIFDIIICDLKKGGLVSIIDDSNNFNSDGVLIIDIGNKSIEEIEYIINNRIYTSII